MKYIEEPTICPCCSAALQKVNDQLFCRNKECSAQYLKKIEHFAKTLNIKGLGPKTIEKLGINSVCDLYYLEHHEVAEVVGEKTASKLLDEIEGSKTVELNKLLAAFSIPLIGETVAAKLAIYIDKIEDITEDVCSKAGLGEKATNNLLTWLYSEYSEIVEFLPRFNIKSRKDFTNRKKVCITGKLKDFETKASAKEFILSCGYTLVDTVTKDLAYLIDENNSSSDKTIKAKKYGITILNNINQLRQ